MAHPTPSSSPRLRAVIAVFLIGSVAGCALTGCGTTSRGPYATQQSGARDSQRAQTLTLEAADLMDTDPERAEALLREALTADLYHGPAHNNLGVIRLAQGDLYGAASEFEWARRLMPGHPDPRLNLGLALERAGKIDDAIEAYSVALEVYPGHLPSIQAIARCQIRHGLVDDRTAGWLEEIAFRGDESWRSWATAQAVRVENAAF